MAGLGHWDTLADGGLGQGIGTLCRMEGVGKPRKIGDVERAQGGRGDHF